MSLFFVFYWFKTKGASRWTVSWERISTSRSTETNSRCPHQRPPLAAQLRVNTSSSRSITSPLHQGRRRQWAAPMPLSYNKKKERWNTIAAQTQTLLPLSSFSSSSSSSNPFRVNVFSSSFPSVRVLLYISFSAVYSPPPPQMSSSHVVYSH